MKKVGDLFAELGFKADASDSVKRAFVENLVRAANESSRSRGAAPTFETPSERPQTHNQNAAPVQPQKSTRKETKKADDVQQAARQLSFDFGSDSTSTLFSEVAESKSQRRSS